jgi:hypothetical protein
LTKSGRNYYTATAYRHEPAFPDSASTKQGFEYEIGLKPNEAVRLIAAIANRLTESDNRIRIIVRENGQLIVD